jgi:UDP-N-acetylmuramate--alanine ligase
MNEGIDIVFEDQIDEKITSLQKENTLVIYTPAIKTLGILDYFNQNQFEVLKRAKVLGLITENTDCIAVAGTHGKQQRLPLFPIYAKKQTYLSHVF